MRYTPQQLLEVGKFSLADIEKINTYRGKHNHLGFAYQLTFTRVFNFLPKQRSLELSEEILIFTALQLDVDKALIGEYCKHRQHIARHQIYFRQ